MKEIIFSLILGLFLMSLVSAELPFNDFFQDNVTNLTITVNQNESKADLYLNTNGTSFNAQSISGNFTYGKYFFNWTWEFNLSEILSYINGQIETENGSNIPYFNSFLVTPDSSLFYILNYSLQLNMTYANNNISIINNYLAQHPLPVASDRHIIFTKNGTNYTLWNNKGYGDIDNYKDNINEIINERIAKITVPEMISEILPVINRSTELGYLTLGPILDKVDINYTVGAINLSSVQLKNGTYTIPVSLQKGNQTLIKNVTLILRGVQNNPPVIISTPATEVNETQLFSYQIITTDADNDILTFSLTQAPSWISINASGFISGTAPNVSSDTMYVVSVRVSDGTDFATQTFNVTIRDIIQPDTTPPIITVFYPTNNQVYNSSTVLFEIITDEATNLAWYRLNSGSNVSMTQTSTTSFNNTVTLIDGNYTLMFYARDLAGNIGQSSSVNFSVDTSIPDTTPPIINILFPQNSANYTSHVTEINYTVSDINLDKCWYTLDNGLTNMTIECNTLIVGITSINGINLWIVYANDSVGNLVNKSVTFNVNISVLNNPPVITSTPITQVNGGANYSYQVIAIDNDNDTLTYSLTQAPTWLSINSSTGEITVTTPLVSIDTNFSINVSVSDGITNVTQSYVLTVKNIPRNDEGSNGGGNSGNNRGGGGSGRNGRNSIQDLSFENQQYLNQFIPKAITKLESPAVTQKKSNGFFERYNGLVIIFILLSVGSFLLIFLIIFLIIQKEKSKNFKREKEK